MTVRACALAALVALTGGLGADDKDGKTDDKDKLQGEWVAVSFDARGKPLPDNTLKMAKITFKGDEVTTVVGGPRGPQAFKLDPSKTPKEIDFTLPKALVVVKGIYELEGDTLTICSPPSSDGERPQEFKAGTTFNLRVYKRAEKK